MKYEQYETLEVSILWNTKNKNPKILCIDHIIDGSLIQGTKVGLENSLKEEIQIVELLGKDFDELQKRFANNCCDNLLLEIKLLRNKGYTSNAVPAQIARKENADKKLNLRLDLIEDAMKKKPDWIQSILLAVFSGLIINAVWSFIEK